MRQIVMPAPRHFVAVDQYGIEVGEPACSARDAFLGIDHQDQDIQFLLHDGSEALRRHVAQLHYGGEGLGRCDRFFKGA